MAISKYLKLGSVFLLLTSCSEYFNQDYSFQGIYLKEWNSSVCPKKIVYEKYERKTNFTKIINSYSDFEIRDCESQVLKYNQRLFTPITLYKGQINYDIRLIIDDSLEFKITNIHTIRDTTKYVFTLGKKYYINNTICSMIINGHHSDNKDAKNNIVILTKLGNVIKN
ncbi:hypothetical protein EV144_101432 [Flavobacterium sp. 270]|uniref:hypothetical protein n=1 Tax=Flavobacterium sp. 270 TaxID=2512114 RepID=UPI001066BB18|nr:hypothetical protein [Flavobacterium sp. 270]TDW51755.1 hypothetical protein EV144_101432 [Flavobacterium sp. 270]